MSLRQAAGLPYGDAQLIGARGVAAISCVLSALVLVVLDTAMVHVALPAIGRSLHVGPAESVRVVTAYQVALVMALLPCAALGESLGYRRVYTAGLAVFVGASGLCAVAPSLCLLVTARFLQGLGAAAVMSLGVALLRLVVSPQQLARAIAWNTLAVALASAAGPTLGAWVLANATWRWLFALNLPLGLLVSMATRALPQASGTARELDRVSIALHAGAFAGLIAAALLMPEHPGPASFGLAGAGCAVFALVRREMQKQAPMIPLDLLRRAAFRASVLASICCFIGQSAAMISLPFYLQHVLGQDVLRAGILMTPWPLSVALIAPIAARLADRISGEWLSASGGALLAFGLALAGLWPLRQEPLAAVPILALCGAGFGLFQVSNNRNLFLSATRERSAAAGGMQSTARLTGQALGASAMTLLFTTTPLELAPRIGLALASALTLIAGLLRTTGAATHER